MSHVKQYTYGVKQLNREDSKRDSFYIVRIMVFSPFQHAKPTHQKTSNLFPTTHSKSLRYSMQRSAKARL